MDRYPELFAKLSAAGQEQVLAYWNELSDAERQELASQLDAIDFVELGKLIQSYVLQRPKTEIPEDLGPAPYFPLVPRDAEQQALYDRARARGEELLRAGKVSCLTVAGGQGTRLGFNGPKGTYPIGPVSGKSLFQYFAESILRTGRKYGCKLTWYVMTSLLNREATENYTILAYTELPNADSSVYVEYPWFQGEEFAELNELIYDKVLELGTIDPDTAHPDWGLIADYQAEVTFQNSRVVSIVFWGDSYFTTSNHPWGNLRGLTVDLETMEEIQLGDLYPFEDREFRKLFFNFSRNKNNFGIVF